MNKEAVPMSGKKLFGFTAVIIGAVVAMGLVFFTNFA
jgi:hypothetical protein